MSTKIKLLIWCAIGLFYCSLCAGCRATEECKAFTDLSREQQRVEFRTFSIEKQLDIYLCAMKAKPPDLSFAQYVADRGEEVIPIVIAKMKTVRKEVEQEDLIYILELISDRGDLRGRKDIMAELSQIIDAMKIDTVRERSLEKLKKIEINSGIRPLTYTK